MFHQVQKSSSHFSSLKTWTLTWSPFSSRLTRALEQCLQKTLVWGPQWKIKSQFLQKSKLEYTITVCVSEKDLGLINNWTMFHETWWESVLNSCQYWLAEVLSFQKDKSWVEMSKKRPLPLMQQNEAEMFQRTINNNFNPSSGALTYKYELHFIRTLW